MKVLERYTVPTETGPKAMEYVSRVDWRNIGIGFSLGNAWLSTPWGNLLACPWERRLFSYRYGYKKCWHFAGLCVSWVRLRESREAPPLNRSQ